MPEQLPGRLSLIGVSFLLIASFIIFSYFQGLGRTSPDSSTNHQVQSNSETVELIEPIKLPSPNLDSRLSLEKALYSRRSHRDLLDQPLTLKQVSQLLWAAQGVTVDWGGRTAPSVKSVYPLTVYLLAHQVETLNPGLYRYWPGDRDPVHRLTLVKPGDLLKNLTETVNQNSLNNAPAVLIVSGDFAKMTAAFDNKKADFNVYLEAGHVGQNIYLEAESLALGTVALSSFDPQQVHDLLELPKEETVIYLFPIGLPKE
jgi:SagB-type dehydrogenase family enzyme